MLKWKVMVISAAISLLASGCGSSLYCEAPEDYQEITSVEGVSFSMPTFIIQTATAIADIREDGNYDKDETYLYKNGVDRYILFNMNSAVVIVQKDTTFDILNADDKKSCIKNGGMEGIIFSSVESVGADKEKVIADINNAQVSVTQDLYGDYAGKIAVLTGENAEWSLFVGIPAEKINDLSKDQKKVVSLVAQSFSLMDEVAGESAQNSIDESEQEKRTAVDEDEENVNQQGILEEAAADTVAHVSVESEAADVSADELPASKEAMEESAVKNSKQTLHIESNQRINGSKNEPSYSTVYSMLSLGDIGIYTTANEFGQVEHECIIEKVYIGKDAEDIIKKYCTSSSAKYDYPSPPAGCSWQAVKYSVDADPDKFYTDIKLCGLDGEKLNYRGVTYTSRTHDIYSFAKRQDDLFSDMYCFYAIPNGCKEYVLRVGDQNPDDPTAMNVAYYRILL